MDWYKEPISKVLEHFAVDKTKGKSESEVLQLQEQHGRNEFEEQKKETLLQKILHHLKEIPTMILIAASIIATAAAIMNHQNGTGSTGDWAKIGIILVIVLINVVLGIYQENKAEQALDALKKMNSFKTTVIRGGEKKIIDAAELVPGDIVELNAGDVVTADGRIIDASSLQIEEAALTGESQPADKDPDVEVEEGAPLGDRFNMVYSGCLVTGGRATVVVTATAMQTEMGKIAKLLNTTEKMLTPLQMRLKQLAKRISIIALLAGVAMFIIGFSFWGNSALEMLLLAVALGVAAVPETLPIVVTMILSYGVFNMVTKKAIVRKIPAVETVGNTSVICSDKTGTLTLNKMKIQKLWHVRHDPISISEIANFNKDQKMLASLLTSCSNATIQPGDGDNEEHVIGDPTEIAIIRLLHDLGINRVHAEREYPRVHEIPFDSGRKRMTTLHSIPESHGEEYKYIAVTKGAFDRIPVDWTPQLQAQANEIHDAMAENALRVIAVSVKKYKEYPTDLSIESLESGQEFRGMVGMIDPPRPESAAAVLRAKEAGIKTVMITGDHIETAKAIASVIGIFEPGDRAVTGTELAQMSDTDLISIVRGISVYARVSPEDKLRIVKAWQHHDAVVTMTGDGVNDAPALKAADVGAAMGITGTEVSKNAADMVITDDNFATIVDAVSEGRTSYDNIRKIIQFLLGVNFAEIFVLLFGMVVLGRATITAMQILIINVVYDGIPGFCLAFEKPEPDTMKRKPLPKNSGVFASRVGFFIGIRATTFSILTMVAYFIGSFVQLSDMNPVLWDGTWTLAAMREGGNFAVGTTMAFLVLSWASTIDVFNTRTKLSIFQAGFLSNKGAFFTVIGALTFSVVVAVTPFLMDIFSVVYVSVYHWVIMIVLALAQVMLVELVKLVLRIKDAKSAA